MFRRFLALSALLFLGVSAPLRAQESPDQQPEPAARFDRWLGSWVSDSGGFECERFGGATVVCRSRWVADTGDEHRGLYINRWDAGNDVFQSYRFYDTGQAGSGFTWVGGDTLTSVMEGPAGSRDKVVWTLTDEGAEYALYRSVRGGPWEYVYTTTFHRAKEGG